MVSQMCVVSELMTKPNRKVRSSLACHSNTLTNPE